jgi:hypothetical protein
VKQPASSPFDGCSPNSPACLTRQPFDARPSRAGQLATDNAAAGTVQRSPWSVQDYRLVSTDCVVQSSPQFWWTSAELSSPVCGRGEPVRLRSTAVRMCSFLFFGVSIGLGGWLVGRRNERLRGPQHLSAVSRGLCFLDCFSEDDCLSQTLPMHHHNLPQLGCFYCREAACSVPITCTTNPRGSPAIL